MPRDKSYIKAATLKIPVPWIATCTTIMKKLRMYISDPCTFATDEDGDMILKLVLDDSGHSALDIASDPRSTLASIQTALNMRKITSTQYMTTTPRGRYYELQSWKLWLLRNAWSRPAQTYSQNPGYSNALARLFGMRQ